MQKDKGTECLQCGHEFGAAEIASMTARKNRADLCVIRCSQCGTWNEARSEPSAGVGAQPALVVRRTIKSAPRQPGVFKETVAPGVDVPPEVAGSSN